MTGTPRAKAAIAGLGELKPARFMEVATVPSLIFPAMMTGSWVPAAADVVSASVSVTFPAIVTDPAAVDIVSSR